MHWLIAPAPNAVVSTALLAVRLSVGVAFILHGLPKMQNPFGWMDTMDSVPPGWLQAAAALAEVAGGALLIAGFLTRPAALLLVCQMIAALVLVHIPKGDPFVAVGQASSELAVTYLLVSALVFTTGPGAWSIDALLGQKAAEQKGFELGLPWGSAAARPR
jgi:putative oxidoreductase